MAHGYNGFAMDVPIFAHITMKIPAFAPITLAPTWDTMIEVVEEGGWTRTVGRITIVTPVTR